MSTIFTTIQLIKFFLCTTHGDSATFYGGGLSQYPFQGVCQGNGAGLAIWLALSLCLIQMIHQFGLPNKISGAIALASIILVVFIHVDDCDLFVLPPSTNLDPQGCPTAATTEYGYLAGLKSTGGTLSGENVPGVDFSTISRLDNGNSIHLIPFLLHSQSKMVNNFFP